MIDQKIIKEISALVLTLLTSQSEKNWEEGLQLHECLNEYKILLDSLNIEGQEYLSKDVLIGLYAGIRDFKQNTILGRYSGWEKDLRDTICQTFINEVDCKKEVHLILRGK